MTNVNPLNIISYKYPNAFLKICIFNVQTKYKGAELTLLYIQMNFPFYNFPLFQMRRKMPTSISFHGVLEHFSLSSLLTI